MVCGCAMLSSVVGDRIKDLRAFGRLQRRGE